MSDLRSALAQKKAVIVSFLESFIAERRPDWSSINAWGPDVLDRLLAFTREGKMLRGALVLWTAEFLGKKEEDALALAAAFELLQSSLLAHDDVMDEDVLRRGLPTMHKQYESWAVEHDVRRPDHFGVSMAVCVGDLSLFLAYELLARAKVRSPARVLELFSRLVAIVGLGQMQDIFFGMSDAIPREQDILAMYEHKTATYTFSLPLLLGAIVGEAADVDLSLFDAAGKVLGVMFQLKDDELGLFGAEDELGKTVGIDIITGKKTVFYTLLLQLLSGQERARLVSLQSLRSVDEESLAFVRSLLEKYHVRQHVDERLDALAQEAAVAIDRLPLSQEGREFFHALAHFNRVRTK